MTKFFARAHFRARCALEISDDLLKISEKSRFSTLSLARSARGSVRAPKKNSEMNSLEKIDVFCTINELKKLKTDN